MHRRHFLLGATGAAGLALAGLPAVARAGKRTAPDSDAIVIGAGLAGLAAARTLEVGGANVTVLEANERVGGRLHTVTVEGMSFEVGGVEVGAGYGCLHAHARASGVEIADADASAAAVRTLMSGGTTLALGEQLVRSNDWTASPLNPLQGRERALPPPAMLGVALNALAWPDLLPLQQTSDHALDIPLSQLLAQQGWSPQAIAWMDVTDSFTSLDSVSAWDALRRDALRRQGEQKTGRVAGGSQRLPEGMAATLAHPVQNNAHVVSVEQRRGKVEVSCADGRRLRAAHVLVAIPSGPLSRIRFDPLPPPAQRQVWRQRRSNAVTTVSLRPLRRFWEDDGLPSWLWSDGPLQRVMAIPGDSGRIDRLVVWLNGAAAEHADRLAEPQRMAWAISELGKLRPASVGALAPLATRSWGADPLADGAFSEIAPGQVAAVMQWSAARLGQVHFAGEQTVLDAPGMEAAVVSGERAAKAILG